MAGPLGRRPPTDDRHIQRYPLTATTVPRMPTPVVLGLNWYAAFDTPLLKDGNFWIGRGADWGPVRGGHAICIKPPALLDRTDWWGFYDQGHEGACVGFSLARMMTLLNRKRYAAGELYVRAKQVDEWPGEDYDGTSVRAGCDVLRDFGARPTRVIHGVQTAASWMAAEGIAANRWAKNIADIAWCLSPADYGATVTSAGYVALVNSWGQGYPHQVRLPLAALQRLVFEEDGEAAVVTDR